MITTAIECGYVTAAIAFKDRLRWPVLFALAALRWPVLFALAALRGSFPCALVANRPRQGLGCGIFSLACSV